MIKRTPQEIADFYGCYVAQDKSGDWYLYEKAPAIDLSKAIWTDGGVSTRGMSNIFMDFPEGHDWTKLYGPQGNQGKTEGDFPYSAETADSDNKQDAYSGKPADSDNKASHQSQVHVHQEYDLVSAVSKPSLISTVDSMMRNGWEPQGGASYSSGLYYQAMVRGV